MSTTISSASLTTTPASSNIVAALSSTTTWATASPSHTRARHRIDFGPCIEPAPGPVADGDHLLLHRGIDDLPGEVFETILFTTIVLGDPLSAPTSILDGICIRQSAAITGDGVSTTATTTTATTATATAARARASTANAANASSVDSANETNESPFSLSSPAFPTSNGTPSSTTASPATERSPISGGQLVTVTSQLPSSSGVSGALVGGDGARQVGQLRAAVPVLTVFVFVLACAVGVLVWQRHRKKRRSVSLLLESGSLSTSESLDSYEKEAFEDTGSGEMIFNRDFDGSEIRVQSHDDEQQSRLHYEEFRTLDATGTVTSVDHEGAYGTGGEYGVYGTLSELFTATSSYSENACVSCSGAEDVDSNVAVEGTVASTADGRRAIRGNV